MTSCYATTKPTTLESVGLDLDPLWRNSHPDFRVVQIAKGFKFKGLAYPGYEVDYDCKALIRTGNPKYLYLAGFNWPAERVSAALVKALRETGDAYWTAQAKASWKVLSFS